MAWATPGWWWRRRRRTTAAALLRGRAARVSSRAAPPGASKRGRVVGWWCGACPRARAAFIAMERHRGDRMVWGVRWWRGHAACGTGTSWAATCGLGRHGAVPGGCKGGVGMLLAVGAGSGAFWSARGGHGIGMPAGCSTACRAAVQRRLRAGGRGLEQGARVGEHLGSKGQLQDVVVQRLAAGLVKCPWWSPCPWHSCLALGFRAWRC